MENETTTFSNVDLGVETDHRLIMRRKPFLVNGIAATRLAGDIWGYRILPGDKRATITDIEPPSASSSAGTQ